MLAESRRAAIVDLLRSTGSVTVGGLEERFGISSMTARRDLADLERQGLARRTHGGAVLPAISAHEDSFVARVETAPAAKQALARAAVATLAPRQSVFLDSSSTAYFVAQRILEEGLPLTIITNSLPVMELVGTSDGPNVELIGVGGSMRRADAVLRRPLRRPHRRSGTSPTASSCRSRASPATARSPTPTRSRPRSRRR